MNITNPDHTDLLTELKIMMKICAHSYNQKFLMSKTIIIYKINPFLTTSIYINYIDVSAHNRRYRQQIYNRVPGIIRNGLNVIVFRDVSFLSQNNSRYEILF